jgi:hypothetical protein
VSISHTIAATTKRIRVGGNANAYIPPQVIDRRRRLDISARLSARIAGWRRGLVPARPIAGRRRDLVGRDICQQHDGAARLTGSPQHQAYVHYLKQQLRKILRSAGGDVFEDSFENYPRWTAKSWGLLANS